MGKMKQADHIDFLEKRSAEREKKAISIQKQYLRCLGVREESAFDELLLLLDEYCIPWVRKQFWNAGFCSDEVENIALQDARMRVFEAMRGITDLDQARDNFAYYAFGIYKNKTLNAIRKEFNRRNNLPTVSTEEPIGESGRIIEDILPPVLPNDGEKDEQREVFDRVFHIYCTAFLTSKAFPPRCIALCYARVLPHLLDAIPESKATSAKWAFTRMESQSLDSLKRDSEYSLQCNVDRRLAWGAEFIRQLDDELTISGKAFRLGDVIYTEVYDKAKIEDWAESMHKATIKAAIALLAADRGLLNLVKDYATDDNVLNRFLGKEEDRCR